MRVFLAPLCFALFPDSSRHGHQPSPRTWSSSPCSSAPAFLALTPLCWFCQHAEHQSVFPREPSTSPPTQATGAGPPPPTPLPSPFQGSLRFPETQLSPSLTHFPSYQPSVCHTSSYTADTRCEEPPLSSALLAERRLPLPKRLRGACPRARVRADSRDVMEMHAPGPRTWRIQ